MFYVDEYFEKYELKNNLKLKQKTIYVATDDEKIIDECKLKYPAYNFIYDRSNANWSSHEKSFTPNGMKGTLLDIFYLSRSQFVVCTFSSNFCRLVYELMLLANRQTTTKMAKSLDIPHFFGWNLQFDCEAILENSIGSIYEESSQKEQWLSDFGDVLEFKKGDLILFDNLIITAKIFRGYQRNGFMTGVNKRTNKGGYFPSFKVKIKYD